MKTDTKHAGTLVPPVSSITHDIEITVENVDSSTADLEHPYFVMFSVAYEDHKRQGFLVEVEWALQGNKIIMLKHSSPQSYEGPTILE